MSQIKDLEKVLGKLKLSFLADQGKQLERLISARQLSGRQNQLFKNELIPQYKFYTGLYEDMLSQRKNLEFRLMIVFEILERGLFSIVNLKKN